MDISKKFLLRLGFCLLILSYCSAQNKTVDLDTATTLESILQSNNDKVIILNFWASWCKPCIKNLKKFVELSNKKEHVEVVFVNIDMKLSEFQNLSNKYGLHKVKFNFHSTKLIPTPEVKKLTIRVLPFYVIIHNRSILNLNNHQMSLKEIVDLVDELNDK